MQTVKKEASAEGQREGERVRAAEVEGGLGVNGGRLFSEDELIRKRVRVDHLVKNMQERKPKELNAAVLCLSLKSEMISKSRMLSRHHQDKPERDV